MGKLHYSLQSHTPGSLLAPHQAQWNIPNATMPRPHDGHSTRVLPSPCLSLGCHPGCRAQTSPARTACAPAQRRPDALMQCVARVGRTRRPRRRRRWPAPVPQGHCWPGGLRAVASCVCWMGRQQQVLLWLLCLWWRWWRWCLWCHQRHSSLLCVPVCCLPLVGAWHVMWQWLWWRVV